MYTFSKKKLHAIVKKKENGFFMVLIFRVALGQIFTYEILQSPFFVTFFWADFFYHYHFFSIANGSNQHKNE